MKKARVTGGAASVFVVLTMIGYFAMHIYFAYIAITSFKFWVAIIITLMPVGGDMLLVGACIASGNWIPAVLLCVVGVLYTISHALALAADKQNV